VTFSSVYRLSFYTMLFFATLVLNVESVDVSYGLLFPAAVATAGVVAFLTVDRNRSLAVSNLSLNLLALGSLPLAALEYVLVGPGVLLLALGHWLVYLQLILMFRPKTISEDWELFLLGLVQVMVGTVVGQSDTVGFTLFAWAVLALWVLGLFSLERDAIRALGLRLMPPGAVELYPGLLNVAFFVSALRVTSTTLALGGVIFLAMPRRVSPTRDRGADAASQHLTGFDDEVQLGQMGEILENDSVVMSVELVTEDGSRVAPEGEPLWRGVTMARYETGRWYRQGRRPSSFPVTDPAMLRDPVTRRPLGPIRQVIKLEPNDSNALFGLRPMLDARAPRRSGPDLNGLDGTITRPDARSGPYDYEVTSSPASGMTQPGEKRPDLPLRRDQLLSVPAAIRPRLRAIAERVIEAALPEKRRADPRARAEALEAYLRDSGRFSYTLKLEVSDPKLDPVEDFLVNRKAGHCEYFASALALLLRSVDIPTRMVNGFKGGDWNGLARVLYVRQKHAHSWVEAYLGEDDSHERRPVWLSLDPTPGNARDESVALVGGFRGKFRQVTDLVRYVWVFYVVGYNSERQDRLLYQPIRNLMKVAQSGFAIMGEGLRREYARLLRLLHFETTRSLISPRGFFVSFGALLALVGLYRGAAWVVRRVVRRLRGRGEDSSAQSVGVAQYRRLARLLAGFGLERPPAETQDEFARRATGFLTARGSNTEAVADVPGLVVDAFYRVRFGHLDLSPSALTTLEERLDALEARLAAPQE